MEKPSNQARCTPAAPSLHAPWLEDMLAAANKLLVHELAKIRQLLEKQLAVKKSAVGETKAARRETR